MRDIELRNRIHGLIPRIFVGIDARVGQLRLVGLGIAQRPADGSEFRIVLVFLLLDRTDRTVVLDEGIDRLSLVCQRIGDAARHLDVKNRGTVGVEFVLPAVTRVAAGARRRIGQRRRQIEHQLRTAPRLHPVFQPAIRMFGDILLAERQRLAQRIITAFEQRRIVRSAVTEIGRIVGVAGEGSLLLGLHGVARHADVAVQVAGRELILHPAVGLGDQRVGLVGRTRVEHIDVIGESARLLPVAEQFRTMQFHPRIERALLDPLHRTRSCPWHTTRKRGGRPQPPISFRKKNA